MARVVPSVHAFIRCHHAFLCKNLNGTVNFKVSVHYNEFSFFQSLLYNPVSLGPWSQEHLTPLKEGGAANSVPDMERMLEEYYSIRGLDPEGKPTGETLKRAGLSDIAAKL